MPNDSTIQKLAVFDFCETLVDFQTASAFVDYVRHHVPTAAVRRRHALFFLLTKAQVFRLVGLLTAHNTSFPKRVKLWQLRGIPQQRLEQLAEEFYTERILPHTIAPVVERLRQLQSEGYTVGLSSGGYGIYLKHFVKAFGLDFCHCSEIGFSDGRCTGRMVGRDCMRGVKAERLTQSFGDSPADSLSFSDHISDLPLLGWTDTAFVVSHRTHQTWIEKYHFNEIIWQ